MTAPPPAPGKLTEAVLPDWEPWVSTTGRWWAAYRSVLTRQEISAGCTPLVYAGDAEGLAARIREQETLRRQNRCNR